MFQIFIYIIYVMKQFDPFEFRQQTRRNYDRMSNFYDLLSGGTEKRLVNAVIKDLVMDCPQTIIEIGCGTGNGLCAFRKRFPTAQMIGFDLSFGMCARAMNKCKNLSKNEDLIICQAEGLILPIKSSALSTMFISFTFELFPEKLQGKLLKEIKRVLTPQARITVISMFKDKKPTWISRVYAAAHNRFPKIVDCRPIDTPEIFKQNGFSIIEQSLHNIWGIPVISFTAVNQT